MRKTVNLKKRKLIGKRELIVMALAVVLTTVGIKASDTLLNSDEEKNLPHGQCEENMVFVNSSGGGFCIDKYEATPGKGCPYQEPANQKDTRLNLDYSDCKPETRFSSRPWRFISQNQAAMACAKAGKRLPTNAEWLAASLGTPDKDGGWSEGDCQVANNWQAQPGTAGAGENCQSAAGAYDMIGNVWEWVEGTVSDGMYKGNALPNNGYILAVDDEAMPSATDLKAKDENYYNDYFWIKQNGVRGIARGGYWDNGADAGQYALYVVSEPSFAGTGVGFRCVK